MSYVCHRPTITSTSPLAPCREIKRLTNGHIRHMKILLANVSRRPLWHKLLRTVAIIRHLPLHVQLRAKLGSQSKQQSRFP